MNDLLMSSFPVSNVPVAQTPLREIPYSHAVAGLIGAKRYFTELDHLDWQLAELDQQIRQGPGQMATCPYCNGSGDCYCKRKGLPVSQCTRCHGSGKCQVCLELPLRLERQWAELRQKQAELRQCRPQLATALEARCQSAPPEIEACSRYHGRLVADVVRHPVVTAIHLAFCDHRPLVLSPDTLWLLLVQGFANHVNANAEELRPQFVKHSGKVEIVVRRDDFLKGSPENPWPEVFDQFTRQIREHIGEATHDLLVPAFSTTGVAERAAAQVVLLDAMQSYFEYRFMSVCGIPQIILEGTEDDWLKLAERTRGLGRFGLEWWTEPLAPILDEFVAATRGQVNLRFWKSIYKWHNVSGGPYTTGWIAAFFPYLKDRQTGRATTKNAWLAHGGKTLQMLLYPDREGDQHRFGGLTTEDFPSGLAKAPFRWEYRLTNVYEMEFLGGFVGVRQDGDTLRLRPEIGWVVREQATV